jgi:flagellar FliJ protein
MKSFKFRLQTVLEQRERQEKAAQQNFAEADAACRRAEELLVELKEIRAALLEELSHRRVAGFDASETQLYHEYMQTIMSSIKDQEAHIKELATTREAFKLHMLNATQDRQVIDKVKSKHRDIHNRERERATQKMMDDLTTTRYIAAQRAQEQTK